MARRNSAAGLSDLALLGRHILLGTVGGGTPSSLDIISLSSLVLCVVLTFFGILYPARTFCTCIGVVGAADIVGVTELSVRPRPCLMGTHLPNLGGSIHLTCLQKSSYDSLSTSNMLTS